MTISITNSEYTCTSITAETNNIRKEKRQVVNSLTGYSMPTYTGRQAIHERSILQCHQSHPKTNRPTCSQLFFRKIRRGS